MTENGDQRVIERHIETYECTKADWEAIAFLVPNITATIDSMPKSITIMTESGPDFSRVVWMEFSIGKNHIDLLLSPSCPLAIVQREQRIFNYLDSTQRDMFLSEAQLIDVMLRSEYERVDFFSLKSPSFVLSREFIPSKQDVLLDNILKPKREPSEVLMKRFLAGEMQYLLFYNTYSKSYALISFAIGQHEGEYKVVIYEEETSYVPQSYLLAKSDGFYVTIESLLDQ